MVSEKIKGMLSSFNLPKHIEEATIKTCLSLPQYQDENADVRRDNVLLTTAFLILSQLQYNKEGAYLNSWERREEIGVFFNLSRKFDRVENMMLKGAKDEVGEDKIDTVGDLANYGLLWLTYIMREHPDNFMSWVEHSLQN